MSEVNATVDEKAPQHGPYFENTSETSFWAFLGKTWALAKPYWQSEDKAWAWGLLLVTVALSLGSVYLSVWFNEWYNTFYNALQNKDEAVFWQQLGWFVPVAAVAITAAVYRYYLKSALEIRWRRWLTHQYFDRWLAHKAFYLMEVDHHQTDNPDQRITEDIDKFTTSSLTLSLDLLHSVVSLGSFSIILWNLSGPLSFTLFGVAVSIPGYMFWAALLYAFIGSWLTHLIGRRLIPLNFEQQKREADLRYSLVRVRENAEPIALYGGEAVEQDTLRTGFSAIWRNTWRIMKKQKQLIGFRAGYNQIATIFPFAVCAPRFFNGDLQLGGLMQINNAFGKVENALAWFIDLYPKLALWRSVVDRLTSFNDRLDQQQCLYPKEGQPISATASASLQVQALTLFKPDGSVMASIDDKAITPQQHTLIKAPSGSGKSTLLRTLGGIWPWYEGELKLSGTRLFLPQSPYLPQGRLRDVLAYPQPADAIDPHTFERVLSMCRLEGLTASLDEAQNWSMVLSLGERQRLAIARALIYQPDWLFLDEATSALDADNEHHMYTALLTELPNTTLISVGHRDALQRYHASIWSLTE
jgi:putative ATP-binding cassette transporter